MRRIGFLVGALAISFSSSAFAQEVLYFDPQHRNLTPEEKKKRDEEAKEKEASKEQVSVRAKPPARSASDWEVDQQTIQSAPHQDGADVLETAPGVFISDRGLLGRAPRLSLRGFDGTAGQDVEIFAGNVPLNQVSNIRAPGYADTRFIMPEVIRAIRVSHGPYDPRQGDFAVAGSVHMDLGLEAPGFWASGTEGSFNSRRVFLGFAPADTEWRDSFAAFETSATDGVGTGRAGQRSSFLGQLAFQDNRMIFRGVVGVGTSRYDFPGFLAEKDVLAGEYAYDSSAIGRDSANTAFAGTEFIWSLADGTLALSAYAMRTEMEIHQNLTGYNLDVIAGLPPTNPDDGEQVNQATTVGLGSSYRHGVKLISDRDVVEVGASARLDFINQSDTRLFPDGTINQKLVDADISATNIAAYADTAIYPFRHFVLRAGLRLDSLSFSTMDHTANQGLSRDAQGFHLGEKVTGDYALGSGAHAVVSYGEGFRSPIARELSEGETVPFAIVRSLEGGVRMKNSVMQTSLVAFQSWLDQDRVFDPTARVNEPAPSSSRTGASFSLGAKSGGFSQNLSATYTYAVFTAGDTNFSSGQQVPYAPPFVLRSDTSYGKKIGTLKAEPVTARVGMGLEGAAGATLPFGGGNAKNVFFVDALAALKWREGELILQGTNILDAKYFDSEYFYSSNFEKSPTLPPPSARVLVAPPASVFLTLRIHIDTRDKNDRPVPN